MAVELKIPSVGESITEVEVGEWVKNVGDQVQVDETIVMIETDKVTAEVLAPVAGTITQILKTQGEVATVGDIVGMMEEGAVEVAAAPAAAAAPPPAAPPAAPAAAPTPAAPAAAGGGHVMPAAQRELSQRGMSASDVTGTGPGGRVLKEDVVRASASAPAKPAPAAAPAPAPAAPKPPAVAGGDRTEDVVPMTPLRRKVAERLVQAQTEAALLTTFNEVDMSPVMAIRKEYKDAFIKAHDIKLGYMSFFVKAVVEALKAFPRINAFIEGDELLFHNYYDIGVAVGGGKGLVVPVIRNAEGLGFAEVEQTIADFGRRARDNKLALDELQGGTFTISNGGVYGSLMSTPILNPPQSGILGMHSIQDRPVVVDGEIVVRPMMYIALTYDHRIVDGKEAVSFLKRVKECVEDPTRILLEL